MDSTKQPSNNASLGWSKLKALDLNAAEVLRAASINNGGVVDFKELISTIDYAKGSIARSGDRDRIHLSGRSYEEDYTELPYVEFDEDTVE